MNIFTCVTVAVYQYNTHTNNCTATCDVTGNKRFYFKQRKIEDKSLT